MLCQTDSQSNYLTPSIHDGSCKHVRVVSCQIDRLPEPEFTLVWLVAGIVCLKGCLQLRHVGHLDIFWMLQDFNTKSICTLSVRWVGVNCINMSDAAEGTDGNVHTSTSLNPNFHHKNGLALPSQAVLAGFMQCSRQEGRHSSHTQQTLRVSGHECRTSNRVLNLWKIPQGGGIKIHPFLLILASIWMIPDVERFAFLHWWPDQPLSMS